MDMGLLQPILLLLLIVVNIDAWTPPTSSSHVQRIITPTSNPYIDHSPTYHLAPKRTLSLQANVFDHDDKLDENDISRRKTFQTLALSALGGSSSSLSPSLMDWMGVDSNIAHAATATNDNSNLQDFERKTDKFAYHIAIPSNFKESRKPVKTHLDEINFVSQDVKGYQYGITVDPVRINALKEFGTPEEVAARVVTAEVNRDGVFEVTLLDDPYSEETSSGGLNAYILQYLSEGKRGNKHYWNKIFIANQQLYVLTAQIKQDNYESQAEEMKRVVSSFTAS